MQWNGKKLNYIKLNTYVLFGATREVLWLHAAFNSVSSIKRKHSNSETFSPSKGEK